MAIDLYVPLRKYSSRKFPIYNSPELKFCIIDRKKSHLRHKSSNCADDYQKFSACVTWHIDLRKGPQNYIESIKQSVTVDIKAFCRLANGRRKPIGISPESSYNGEVKLNRRTNSKLVCQIFLTVYSNKAGVTPVTFQIHLKSINMSIVNIRRILKLSAMSPLKVLVPTVYLQIS
ncbi:hypothetical protein JTB14_025788 [Gonioctena quinquepunctata]|nr:hypothetical protein JTB14_025788 [Gonioctena quinquepunctata]